MAIGKTQMYHRGWLKILDRTIDWVNDDIRALLLVGTHTIDLDTHEFVSDISGDEVAGGGDYNRLPASIATKAFSRATGEVRFDGGIADFGDPVTITAGFLVFYKHNASDNAAALLFIVDLDEAAQDVSSTNGKFQISPHATRGWHASTANTGT